MQHTRTFPLLILLSTVPSNGGEFPAREPDLAKLVEDLGHEKWSRRHAAQETLLERGPVVAEHLREALVSPNPEKARRARYLLDEIDPLVGAFDIVRVSLSAEPRIVEVAHLASPPGDDLEARGSSSQDGPSYRLSWHPVSDHKLELRVRRSGSATNSSAARFLAASPAVLLYEVGEEGSYLRCGGVLERERHPYVTLIHQRQERYSVLGDGRLSPEPPSLRDEIVDTLLRQARREDLQERLGALEILGRLRVQEARQHFLGALGDSSTFALGVLGMARLASSGAEEPRRAVELLRELLSREGPPGEERGRTAGWQATRLQAATLLAELGHLDGVPHLIRGLEDEDLFNAHEVLATLSDLSAAIGASELRGRFLETALREDVLGDASWYDPELEYFAFRCLELLNPSEGRDRSRARDLQVTLEKLVAGQFPANRVTLSRLAPLWRRAAACAAGQENAPAALGEGSAPGTMDETPLVRAVVAARGLSSLGEAVTEIKALYGERPLPQDIFEPLVERFRAILGSEESSRLSSPTQRLLDLSRNLRIGEGQLGPWIELLADWVAASSVRAASTATVHELRKELNRWTGIGATALDPRRSPTRSTPSASRPQGDPKTGSSAARRTRRPPPNPWKEWSRQADKVAAREREILSAGGLPSPVESEEEGEALVYYEFDLLLEPERTDPRDAGSSLEVLDGRRLELRAGEIRYYRDRWGNRRRVSLARVGPGQAQPRRYRLDGSAYLTEGAPLLLAGSQARMRRERYVTSNLTPRGRFLSRVHPGVSRTLVLAAAAAEDREGSTGARSAPAGSEPPDRRRAVTELWAAFAERHLLRVGDPPEAIRSQALIRVLEELGLPEARTVLREILRTAPTPLLARTAATKLVALGDPAGRAYFARNLEKGSLQERHATAQTVAALGLEEGPRMLLKLADENHPVLKAHTWKLRSLRALDRYFQTRSDPTADRLFLDLVFRDIGNRYLEAQCFRTIERLAGDDFGYREAARLRGPQREQAVARSIERARAWRQSLEK